MYKRNISKFIGDVAGKYPVVTIIGPRQSGKSTLSKALFPSYKYVSLEETDIRKTATDDPRGFFKMHTGNLILDEIQRVPDMMSFIQTLVDQQDNKQSFVLTGSNQLMLMEKVTQSLAGRTVIAKLLPFSRSELWPKHSEFSIDDFMFTGGYPRIYDKNLEPSQWLQQYYETYVERDVRTLINIGQMDLFERFIRLCAGRVGQLLDLSSLGNDCGISQPTARAWLSVLKMSFICFTLQPHFQNFSKRIIKTPKIYFYDTGLLCFLLGIRDKNILATYPLRGNIFENWVIAEKFKFYYNQGVEPPLYFWRDTKGHEVDLVTDEGNYLRPTEIKSAHTFNPSFIKNLEYFNQLQTDKQPRGEVVYCGDQEISFKDYSVLPWREV